jgi:cell division protein FtsZ
MTINLTVPRDDQTTQLKPRITVIGVGGAGGNAVNNMIRSQLEGVDFLASNTDAQALEHSEATRRIQLGATVTQGLGAGSRPDVGRAAAEESLEEIIQQVGGSNMAFIAAGMGGGTGTGAAPVIARATREMGILTVGVVTKPFEFEGLHRMRIAEAGIAELEQYVDTLIIIPNQNLFRVANERTTFADAFKMADDVLYSGVRGVTDLMVMPGLINLDFADIRSVMGEMGKAMMGTGEAEGESRALDAAAAAIANPLLDDTSMKGAKGMLINITGGMDMTLFEVDEAANKVRQEVDENAYIIFGSTFDESLEGKIRVSVVATGMNAEAISRPKPVASVTTQVRQPAPPKTVDPAFAHMEAIYGTTDEKPEEPKPQPVAESAPAPAQAPVQARAFIPPAPAERPGREMGGAPDPFAVADMVNAGGKTKEGSDLAAVKEKAMSLFEIVTRSGRGDKEAAVDAADSPPPPPAKPAPKAEEESSPLDRVDPVDRLTGSQADKDLLEIPAFLRRQAN